MPQKAIFSNNFFWKGNNNGSLQDLTQGLSRLYVYFQCQLKVLKQKKITTEIHAASKMKQKLRKQFMYAFRSFESY